MNKDRSMIADFYCPEYCSDSLFIVPMTLLIMMSQALSYSDVKKIYYMSD